MFQARVRFAGAVVRQNWVDATMWLEHRVVHPRLHRVESFGRLGFGARFKLQRISDVDGALAALMWEAYTVGRQEGLGRERPPR